MPLIQSIKNRRNKMKTKKQRIITEKKQKELIEELNQKKENKNIYEDTITKLQEYFTEENLGSINKEEVYELARKGIIAIEKKDYDYAEKILSIFFDGIEKEKQQYPKNYEKNFCMGGMGFFASYQLIMDNINHISTVNNINKMTKKLQEIIKKSKAIWPGERQKKA